MLIQESKLSHMSNSIVKDICGCTYFEWVCLDAVGSYGSILLCSKKRVFAIKDEWVGSFSMLVLLKDPTNNSSWIVTLVYGPNDSSIRGNFWSELDYIHSRWTQPWCIRGDWNVIRFPTEKSGGDKVTSDVLSFSDWINPQLLVDLPLVGAKFTWSNHQDPPIMTRLDKFLVSVDGLDLFPKVSQVTLPKLVLDHFPIII